MKIMLPKTIRQAKTLQQYKANRDAVVTVSLDSIQNVAVDAHRMVLVFAVRGHFKKFSLVARLKSIPKNFPLPEPFICFTALKNR